MKWLRLYSEVLNDPKIQRLPIAERWHWVELLCLANEREDRGSLPSITDIAFALRISEPKAKAIISNLTKAGLVDEGAEQLRMHGWNKRQPTSDNAAERMANKRRTSSEHVPLRLEKTREEENREEQEEEEEENAPLSRRPIFVLYDSYMGKPSVTQAISEQLKAAEEEYPPECVEHCFAAAAASSDGRRSWSYVHSILKRHATEGCDERPKTSTANGRGVADPSGLTAAERATLDRLGVGAPRIFVMD